MIRLALVDDNIAALRALKDKLLLYSDLFISHEAANGEELLAMLSSEPAVDLILMDIEMPRMNGITAARLVKERYPGIKVVMVTIYDNDESIFNAIRAGADSYILKETKAAKICEAIEDTLKGGSVMSPTIAARALQALKRADFPSTASAAPLQELSVRETEVLELLSSGLTNKRIAERLSISPFTVKRHIENIYQKLQAQTRVELVDKAKRSGLL